MTRLEHLTDHAAELLAPHGLDGSVGRFAALAKRMAEELGVAPAAPAILASAPGRTELAGNHTDHNQGLVLAASVDLDSIAIASPRTDMRVRLASEGFPLVDISLESLAMRPSERESTASLVRGMAAGFARNRLGFGGFDAAVSSTVLSGSGLSSSASIEVLIGTIFDALHGSGNAGSTVIAQMGKYAENEYFGKPSGLMDQLACATGGAIAIDFADPEHPLIERTEVSFEEAGLSLLVVDTGANHADLTEEYAAIPADMRTVASELGGTVLREVDEERFMQALPAIRRAVGDRAVARALHFYAENRRVSEMVRALKAGSTREYLALMADSGRSSGLFLQNCAPASVADEQGVVFALAITEYFFRTSGIQNGREAACRVHGGGFAGTIQVLLPNEFVESYTTFTRKHLSGNPVTKLGIRALGAVAVGADI